MTENSLDKSDPLLQLKALRHEAENAQTLAEIRIIHQQISVEINRLKLQNSDIRFPEIAEALGTTVERVRRGSRLRVYIILKSLNPGLFDTTALPQEIQDQENEFGEQGVYFEKVEDVITPPDTGTREVLKGEGHGIEEKQVYERVKYVKEVLQMMKVDLFKCKFLYGTTTDKMMRKTTYVLVKIPQLNKMVLVCNEEGNRTFVIYTAENEQKYIDMTKDELKDDPNVRHFKWNSDVDAWKMKLMSLLALKDPGEKVSETSKDVARETPVKEEKVFKKMDFEYFTAENVKADLVSFAKTIGGGKTPVDLNTTNVKSDIKCQNGEMVNWGKYTNRAGVALGFVKKAEEAHNSKLTIINKLLIIAGYDIEEYKEYPLMDKDYFTQKNVKTDLENYALALKLNSPLKINTQIISKKRVLCQNGEVVLGHTYLNRAGIALGFISTTKDPGLKFGKLLNKLFKIAGFDVQEYKEYPPMDAAYFTKENVKTDLEKYAKALNENWEILNLNTSNFADKEVVCCNGEPVRGAAYLGRAGVGLGIIKKIYKASKFRGILNLLFIRAGFEVAEKKKYPIMDRSYFTQEDIKADLLSFALQFGPDKTPLDMNVGNFKKAYCQNGEIVSGSKYLYRYGTAVLGYKKARAAISNSAKILNKLLIAGGYEIEEYKEFVEMNKDYFSPENVKKDLDNFAKQIGEEVIPEHINTNNSQKIGAVCSNGEHIKFSTYLRRAAIEFEFKNPRSGKLDILKKLKQIAGYTTDSAD